MKEKRLLVLLKIYLFPVQKRLSRCHEAYNYDNNFLANVNYALLLRRITGVSATNIADGINPLKAITAG